VELVPHYTDWEKYKKAAGVLRNEDMLVQHEGEIDAGIAFPGGRGTADMVRRVRARGIPLLQVEE
jgi:hypothetical protein